MFKGLAIGDALMVAALAPPTATADAAGGRIIWPRLHFGRPHIGAPQMDLRGPPVTITPPIYEDESDPCEDDYDRAVQTGLQYWWRRYQQCEANG